MKKTLWTLASLACIGLLPWSGGGGCGATAEVPAELAGEDLIEPLSLLTEDHGGYSDADESPGFGLEAVTQFTADAEVLDPSVSPEDEAFEESDPEAQVYMIRIVWGDLARNARGEAPPEDGVEVVGWDGHLSYDGAGTLLAKRTILFEAGDEILGEKDPYSVNWSSVTGPHVDGILTKLIVVPGKETDNLHFETKPLTHDIALADLDSYNEIVSIDEDGHGVAFTAIRIDDNGDCAEGFVDGKYHDRLDGHDGAAFRGRLLGDDGGLQGHVRGHSGVNEADASLFFAKHIDVDGNFAGFFEGSFGDGAIEGEGISARYIEGEDLDSGFFQGHWKALCE